MLPRPTVHMLNFKNVSTLAAVENIPSIEARKKLKSNINNFSSLTSLSSDRHRLKDFSSLSQANSGSSTLSNSAQFYSQNPFSSLSSWEDSESSSYGRTYAYALGSSNEPGRKYTSQSGVRLVDRRVQDINNEAHSYFSHGRKDTGKTDTRHSTHTIHNENLVAPNGRLTSPEIE